MKAKPTRSSFASTAIGASRAKVSLLAAGTAGAVMRPRPFLVQALRLRSRKPAR